MEMKKQFNKSDQSNVTQSSLEWWSKLFYTQKLKEVTITLGCDSGIIGILTQSDIELLYINRSNK